MRAVLAPVIGLLGVVFATSAGAAINLTGEGDNAPSKTHLKYAAETLDKDNAETIAKLTFYKLTATSSLLKINATTDILLADLGSNTRYYIRYDFGGGAGAAFTRNLTSGGEGDFSGTAATSGDATGTPSATAVAYQGRRGDSTVIYQMAQGAYGVGTVVSLDLSVTKADNVNTPEDDDNKADDPGAVLAVRGEGTITATVAIYDDLTDARTGNGNLFKVSGPVINVSRAVSGKIDSMHDVADVGTSDDDGGPFRRFVTTGMGGKNSGVLGKTTVSVAAKMRDAQASQASPTYVTSAIVAKTTAVVTSAAGNFAVSLGEGGTVNTSARKPWMLAGDKSSTADVNEGTACKNGPLTLGVENGTLETYKTDPDGADKPLKKGDLTPAGILAATQATGDAGNASGVNYFCVLVSGNKEAIPEIGDPTDKNSYELTITPVFTKADKRAIKGNAVTKAVGAIDRNGTTTHVAYLSTHEAYNQRLVLVNRGGDDAPFWVNDDSFNLEAGVTLDTNTLTGMVPAKGRLVLRVQDHVTLTGKTRAAATVNVAAPKRNIDVMTIQVHPGTGQIDTTLYQNE